jgi:hypothetical protein
VGVQRADVTTAREGLRFRPRSLKLDSGPVGRHRSSLRAFAVQEQRRRPARVDAMADADFRPNHLAPALA